MRTNGLRAALVVGLLLVAACSDDDDDPSVDASGDDTEQTSSTTTADDPYPSGDAGDAGGTQEAGSHLVNVGETDLGEVLVDADGMTLYLFTQDSGGTSACTEGCAEAWPPLLADGAPSGGDGIDASLLGTIERADGGMQVTYDGHPLYHYAADQEAGSTLGQGVGDVWFAVTPTGEAAS
jgi:predicted lipoprotein with Yx(FWY)xxD motif